MAIKQYQSAPDPITPTDGTQDIQGNLQVAGNVGLSGNIKADGVLGVPGQTLTVVDGIVKWSNIGSVSPALTNLNKGMVGLITSSDGNLATSTGILAEIAGSFPIVIVNGVEYRVGDGTKATVPCYFSGDGGSTARANGGIIVGDKLYWNGSSAGFQLDGSDRIDFIYEVV